MPGVTTLHDPGLLHLHDTSARMPRPSAPGWPRAARPRRRLWPAAARARRPDPRQPPAVRPRGRSAGAVARGRRAFRIRPQPVGAGAWARGDRACRRHPAFPPPATLARPGHGEGPARPAAGRLPGADRRFRHQAKRFDWLIEALDIVCRPRSRRCAGSMPAPSGRRNTRSARRSPRVRRSPAWPSVTGYLDEAALDDHIAAADVLVNLRFPSGGESSGSLARAFAAGTCCIVSDTAAYAELPRDAVLQIPLTGPVPLLAEALRALAAVPARAAAIGERGRRFARAEMALPSVAARYRDVIEDSLDRPVGGAACRRPGTAAGGRSGTGAAGAAGRRGAGRSARRLPPAARGPRPGDACRPDLRPARAAVGACCRSRPDCRPRGCRSRPGPACCSNSN